MSLLSISAVMAQSCPFKAKHKPLQRSTPLLLLSSATSGQPEEARLIGWGHFRVPLISLITILASEKTKMKLHSCLLGAENQPL